MPTPAVVDYVLNGLEAAPKVQSRLLEGDIDWERRASPDRFTLRQMVAHLADWEEIWATRVRRFREEDHPMLESIDEGVLSEQRDYGAQDPYENLRRYAEGRAALLATLRTLDPAEWDRTGHREFVGDLTLFELAAVITGHDGYHLKQSVDSC